MRKKFIEKERIQGRIGNKHEVVESFYHEDCRVSEEVGEWISFRKRWDRVLVWISRKGMRKDYSLQRFYPHSSPSMWTSLVLPGSKKLSLIANCRSVVTYLELSNLTNLISKKVLQKVPEVSVYIFFTSPSIMTFSCLYCNCFYSKNLLAVLLMI